MEEPNPPENRNINTGGGNYNERIEGDYIQGNVFQNIFNLLGGQTTKPVGNPARPKNERILLAAVKEEVTGWLRDSLHNAVLINLDKESQPQQVKRPWDAEIKIGLKPAEPIPDTTTILQVFDSEGIAGKLLILGAPGAGKTTTLLELAQALVSRAEEQPDYPVPVLFNLSSWKDDRQSITDWLVAELKSQYSDIVSIELGKKWIKEHQLLPMLDGLDELKPHRQEYCVQLINQFLSSENKPRYLVVCSRSEEYGNYSTKLKLSGAIYLHPLTINQVQTYLININHTALWQTINHDRNLLHLAIVPLFLRITVIAFKQVNIEHWQQLTSTEERIKYLFDAYWEQQMFNREHKEFYIVKKRFRYFLDKCILGLPIEPDNERYIQQKLPTPEQTQHWLIWLAQQMQRESKTEFLIEEMQPAWLMSKTQKNNYALFVGLFYGLMGGLFFTLSCGLFFGVFQGLLFGLIGIDENKNGKIIFKKINKIQTICGPIAGITVGLIFGIWGGLTKGLFIGLFTGILTGLCMGLLILLNENISNILLNENISNMNIIATKNKENTNRNVWKYACNAIFLGLIVGLFLGLIAGHIAGLMGGLFFGLSCAAIVGLFFSGMSCIQHFTLHIVLYFNNYIPWNYARFLDYSTERLFLQRVGGRYRFIHKLLQDHFAQMEFKRD